MKIAIDFYKKCQNSDDSRILELFTVIGTWIYKFETQI